MLWSTWVNNSEWRICFFLRRLYHYFYSIFAAEQAPDQTFHNFIASKSVDQRFELHKTRRLWGSRIVKCLVGYNCYGWIIYCLPYHAVLSRRQRTKARETQSWINSVIFAAIFQNSQIGGCGDWLNGRNIKTDPRSQAGKDTLSENRRRRHWSTGLHNGYIFVGIRATLIMLGASTIFLIIAEEFPMLAKTPSSSPLINQETTTNTVPMTIFKLQTSSSHYPIALKTSQARQKKYSHKVIPPPLWIFFCKQKYLFREKHEFFVKFVSVKNRKNFTCFRTFPPPFP